MKDETAYTYNGARSLDAMVQFVQDQKYLDVPDEHKKPIPGPPEGFQLWMLYAKFYLRKFDYKVNTFLNENGIQDGTPLRYATYVAMVVVPLLVLACLCACCCGSSKKPEVPSKGVAVAEGAKPEKAKREKID